MRPASSLSSGNIRPRSRESRPAARCQAARVPSFPIGWQYRFSCMVSDLMADGAWLMLGNHLPSAISHQREGWSAARRARRLRLGSRGSGVKFQCLRRCLGVEGRKVEVFLPSTFDFSTFDVRRTAPVGRRRASLVIPFNSAACGSPPIPFARRCSSAR